jgi:hypothetical protein
VAGAKAAAEPASRVAMASFIMVAGVLFCYGDPMESARRQAAASNNKAGGGLRAASWILCVPLVEHVSLHRDTDSKVE